MNTEISQGAERTQRFSSEAERLHVIQIGKVSQFGSVMLESQSLEIGFLDAASIVHDLDGSGAEITKTNFDGSGTRIHGILQQLLQRRSQVQNHLGGRKGINDL